MIFSEIYKLPSAARCRIWRYCNAKLGQDRSVSGGAPAVASGNHYFLPDSHGAQAARPIGMKRKWRDEHGYSVTVALVHWFTHIGKSREIYKHKANDPSPVSPEINRIAICLSQLGKL